MLKQHSPLLVSRSEQLVHNVIERFRDDIKSVKLVLWPPRVEDLEDVEELLSLMVQVLSDLQGKKRVDLSPSTVSHGAGAV